MEGWLDGRMARGGRGRGQDTDFHSPVAGLLALAGGATQMSLCKQCRVYTKGFFFFLSCVFTLNFKHCDVLFLLLAYRPNICKSLLLSPPPQRRSLNKLPRKHKN